MHWSIGLDIFFSFFETDTFLSQGIRLLEEDEDVMTEEDGVEIMTDE